MVLWNRIRKNWGLYLLLLPSFILLACFYYRPIYGVVIAFKDFKPVEGIWNSQWVGLKHFTRFFNSYQSGTTIKNTIILSCYHLFAAFPFPFMLALLVNQLSVKFFRKTFQVVTYLPHFISMVVLVAILILLLSPSSGMVGNFFKLLKMDAPNLMGKAGAFRHIFVWSDIWQRAGWDSIIYIAALSAVDPNLYEAAVVDGAKKWHKLRYIDLPMLLPTATILLILRSGNIMNVGFEKVYLMQNPLNLLTSEVIATYVYKIGLINTQYSLSAAVNLFNNAINFLMLVMVNLISRKFNEDSLW